MKPFRVGLTGGIASGKSTVAQWLREAGFTVIDSDLLVAELYRPGRDGTAVIERLFGPSFLTDEGGVDHQSVADRVFADPANLADLESAIHPLVKREFETLARSADLVAVLEAPLLVEAGFAPNFDLVVTVEATPQLRIQRAVARGLTATEAQQRFGAQANEATRLAAADIVLHNNGSLDELHQQVEELVIEICRRAENA
jgi:dephospho-CoA kinase